MASVMAIVSKAVFERDGRIEGRLAEVGDVLPLDRYLSKHRRLQPLADGGTLYLVTVRPPDESLWLVASLRNPRFVADHWEADENSTPVTDIGSLREKLRFDTGKGIVAKPGALGMSLQTPRHLTEGDVALLRGASARDARAETSRSRAETSRSRAVPSKKKTTKGGLAAVLADPGDLQARLVYADELMEKGDPRGELISAQCQLALGTVFHSLRNELAAQAQALLKAHRAEWLASVGLPKKAKHRFEAGFLCMVETTLTSISRAGDELFAREPVQRLIIEGITAKNVKRLEMAAWLPQVRALTLRGELEDEGAEVLARLPLEGVEKLNVVGHEIGPEGAEVLARSTSLASLKQLSLSGNPIGDEGLYALCESPLLASVERLYLSNCELSDAGVRFLLKAEGLTQLQKLGLADNYLSDDAIMPLIEEPSPTLKRLEIKNTGISWQLADALSQRYSVKR